MDGNRWQRAYGEVHSGRAASAFSDGDVGGRAIDYRATPEGVKRMEEGTRAAPGNTKSADTRGGWSLKPAGQAERASFGRITGELEAGLLSKVYTLLAFSLAFSVAGGFVGYGMAPGFLYLLFPLELALIFAISRAREAEPWNLILLYAFAFVSGMTLGPLIQQYVHAGYGAAVLEAAVATALVVGALAWFGQTVRADLRGWGFFLFAALVSLIGVNVLGLFLSDSWVHTAAAWGGALLFSLFLIFDVNRTRFMENTMGNAVIVTLDLYLDVVNLFLYLLQIISDGDD